MKTLFLSLNKDYFLDSAGSNIVLKYDLFNDIMYEIGAELAFMVKDDCISDKVKIITDTRDARPEVFAAIVDKINTLVIWKLLLAEIPEETTFAFPDSYVDWLSYNSNRAYAEIGRKLHENGNSVTLCLTDIYEESTTKKFLAKVRDTVIANNEINKFTIVGNNDPESNIVKTIIDMRANLVFEPYDGGWLQYEIGYALENGIGVVKNLDEAFKYYLQSAKKHEPRAANRVGDFYRDGLGTTQSDISEALRWFNIAAELKNGAAAAKAAFIYHHGIMRTGIDYNKAAELYECALANNGADSYTLFNYAFLCYSGKLGAPDYTKVFTLVERGAESDDIFGYKCASTAGHMLHNGRGVEKNDKKALDYLEKALEIGFPEDLYLAGKLHADGAGTDGIPDLESAKTAFRRGIDAGDADCALELARIYLRQEDASSSDIISNLKFAADKDNHDAIFELAKYLHDNKDVGADIQEAYSPIALLTKLAETNYSGADELRACYQKEIDDEKARIEREKKELEEKEEAHRREEEERKKKELEVREARRREEEERKKKELEEREARRREEEEHKAKNKERYHCIKQCLYSLVYSEYGDPNQYIEMLVNEVRLGDPMAKALLGYILLRRNHSDKNAKEMLLSSIKPVSPELFKNFYWEHDPVSQMNGVHPDCYALISWMYSDLENNIYKTVKYARISIGETTDPDNPKFSISHDSDMSPVGLMRMGWCYLRGYGVPKDLDKADIYLSKAVKNDKHMAKAYYIHALCNNSMRKRPGYYVSDSTIKDNFLCAAKLNYSPACKDYAVLLIKEREKAEAEEWLHKAIKYSGGNLTDIEKAQKHLRSINGEIIEYKILPEVPVYFDETGPTLEKPEAAPAPIIKAEPDPTPEPEAVPETPKKKGGLFSRLFGKKK